MVKLALMGYRPFFRQKSFPKEKHSTNSGPDPYSFKTDYDYTLNDLMNYNPLNPDEINGPEHERPLISDLSYYLDTIGSRGYVPLRNIGWTRHYGSYEVDLMQDCLLLPKGRLVTFRYEVKAKETWNPQKIRDQLNHISGVQPVWVEQVNNFSNRLKWLHKKIMGDPAVGLILLSNGDFYSEFNFELIEPDSVASQISSSYSGRDKDLMLATYALLKNLCHVRTTLEDGLLWVDDLSFCLDLVNDSSNVYLAFNPVESSRDSVLIINPYAGRDLIKGLIVNNPFFGKIFKGVFAPLKNYG